MEIYMNETQNSVINRFIDMHIEQTITDEMAQRVLAPVLAKIQAGDFDESMRKARLNTARRELLDASRYLYVVIIESAKPERRA